MKMNSALFVFAAFFIYANLGSVHSFTDSSHAMCKPRLTVIQVDKEFANGKDYFPFFVQVHRCNGSCFIHPSDQSCEPLTSQTIKIPVFDRSNSKQVFVTIKNHTSCRCDCVKSVMDCRLDLEDWKPDQCRCDCRYPKAPPKDLACKPGFRWDELGCRCKCDTPPKTCPTRKEWNKEACNCTCSKRVVNRCHRKQKGLDHATCQCVDVQALRRDPADKSNSGMYLSIMIIQGVVIFGLTCVLIKFIVKSPRSPRRSITYTDGETGPQPPKTPPSMADSGNISGSNGSVQISDVKAKYKSNSNGSVCLSTQVSRESAL